MIDRRTLLAGLSAGAATAGLTQPASAQSWKQAYPELVYAVVPAENASGVTDTARSSSICPRRWARR